MSSSVFFRTVISGFIATFVMAMIAFLLGGIGFPAIDIGYILTESFNYSLPGDPYHIIFGNIAYNLGGILVALIWVAFLQHKIPGNWIVQGLIYGLVISVVAGLVISPFVSMAAGEDFGLFYTNTWFPGRMIFAGLFMHLSFGLTLTLCLKVADVNEKES
jgi:hypothetical protein